MDPTRLRTELEQLAGRIRGYGVLYGLLEVAVVVSAALAAAFLLDRWLSLPTGVRLFFLALIAVSTGWVVFRAVLGPLRERLTAEDAAVAVERRYEEFDGRLLSTLELEGEALGEDRNVSVELVNRLREETARVVDDVEFGGVFEFRSLRRVALVALVLLVVDVGYGVVRPDLAGIFFSRLVGQDVRWPQRIFLAVEFPGVAEHYAVERDAGDRPTAVRIARGASLPVTVRAGGETPRFVELKTEIEGEGRGAALPLTPTAGGEWVGRFKNVRAPFTFWAHDGDVNDDSREIEVSVFTPPGVQSVAALLDFPAYTGLDSRREDRGDVEAPVGTTVRLEIATTGEVVSGTVEFDDGSPPTPLEVADASAGVWTMSFPVIESLAYTIHLEGKNGFRNLEPVTHAVIAVKDRAPTARIFEPARAHVEVTPEGLVPIRLAADDDYGIARLSLTMNSFGIEASREFDLLESDGPDADPRRKVIYALLDLPKLSFEHEDGVRVSQIGDSYTYGVTVEDNRQGGPEDGANRTVVTDRRVDVVSQNEKMRLLTERQIRLKDEVVKLRELQDEKLVRLNEILIDYEASEGDLSPEADELAAAEIGQAQITNRATRLSRDFADLYEEYLLNRIDRSAAAERMIPLLVERKRASTGIDGFDFGIYRPIVETYRGGTFGQLDVLGRLLEMVSCILDVAEWHSPRAGGAVGDARLVVDAAERPEGIRAAIAHQQAVLEQLDALLEKMDEWEDFQEVLTLFRDLLEDQRDLNSRTRDSLRSGNR